MGSTLRDQTVLVVGRGSGIARAVTLLARQKERESSSPGETKPHWPAPIKPLVTPGSALRWWTSPTTRRSRRSPTGSVPSTTWCPPGVHAFKLNVGYLGVGITNGAVDFLTRWLAVELAPLRVNAISPGVIDTGAWDAMGEEGKRDYFEHISSSNPARRIGTTQDIAQAVLFAMTDTFLTGLTLRVDGGEPLT